ncbi:hypothetical protein SOVF_165930, partial [Spinacia oleracea]
LHMDEVMKDGGLGNEKWRVKEFRTEGPP